MSNKRPLKVHILVPVVVVLLLHVPVLQIRRLLHHVVVQHRPLGLLLLAQLLLGLLDLLHQRVRLGQLVLLYLSSRPSISTLPLLVLLVNDRVQALASGYGVEQRGH